MCVELDHGTDAKNCTDVRSTLQVFINGDVSAGSDNDRSYFFWPKLNLQKLHIAGPDGAGTCWYVGWRYTRGRMDMCVAWKGPVKQPTVSLTSRGPPNKSVQQQLLNDATTAIKRCNSY